MEERRERRDLRSGRNCFHVQGHQNRGPRAPGRVSVCPWRRGADAFFHECRDAGRHQGRRQRLRPAGARLPDRAVEYLSSASASGRRCGARAGRAAPLHALGRPDSHGLGRVSGVLARGAAQDLRGGRDVRQPSRRAPNFHGAGGEHAHSVEPRLGHRDGLRRVRGEPCTL